MQESSNIISRFCYMTGGLLTIVGAPLIGRLADRFGKVHGLSLRSGNRRHAHAGDDEPAGGAPGACHGRLRSAYALQRRPDGRGPFHRHQQRRAEPAGRLHERQFRRPALRVGPGRFVSGKIIVTTQQGALENFGKVGLMAVAATVLSLWLAGRVRSAEG